MQENREINQPAFKNQYKKPFYKNVWFWLFFLVLVAFINRNAGNSSNADKTQSVNTVAATQVVTESTKETESPPAVETTPEPVEAIKVTAEDLYNEYEKNEVAADLKYKDKLVEVTGVAIRIQKDSGGNPYVAMKTETLTNLVFWFDKSNNSQNQQLAQINPNQKVTITGKNKGMGGGLLSENIEFSNSQVLNIGPELQPNDALQRKSILKQLYDDENIKQ